LFKSVLRPILFRSHLLAALFIRLQGHHHAMHSDCVLWSAKFLCVSVSQIWNIIMEHLKDIHNNREHFKSGLKNVHYQQAYCIPTCLWELHSSGTIQV